MLEASLVRLPDEPRALNLLGLSYFKLGLLDAAKGVYERLADRFPDELPLQINLGLVLLRQGDLAAAEAVFRQALEVDPEHRRAHNYLGMVLYRRGALQEARRHFLAGGAENLADKVDHRGTDAPTHVPDLISQVSGFAEQAMSRDAQPFQSVDPDEEQRFFRDEAAWEVRVEHHQPPPIPEPAEETGLPASAELMIPGSLATAGTPKSDAGPTTEPKAFSSAPELVFNLDSSPRSHLTPDEVEALEGGLGRPGFVAGPGSRAKLTLEGQGAIRDDALVLGLGRKDFVTDRFGQGWWAVEGPVVLLLSVVGVAVALRGVRDAVFAPGALVGFEGEWNFTEGVDGQPDVLVGRGTALLRSAGSPLIVPLTAGQAVVVAPAALLAWSKRLEVAGQDEAYRASRVECRGPGWIVVGDRGAGG